MSRTSSARYRQVHRPDLAELIALNGQARALPLRPRRIRAHQGGQYLSSFKGRGMEFDEVRPYQPGDDVRNLDWRVTARTGRVHTKLFREERERPVILCVDLRPAMYFATRGAFKAVLAAHLAGLLAWSAQQHGDRIGGLLFGAGRQHLELRPRRGRKAVLHLLQKLAGAERPEVPMPATQLALQPVLTRLQRVARPGSLVALISDFRGLDAQAEQQLLRQSRHSDILLIPVHDTLEMQLPEAGRFRLSDGLRSLWLDSNDQQARQDYQQRFLRNRETLERLARVPGVRLIPCATHQNPLGQLQQGLGVVPHNAA